MAQYDFHYLPLEGKITGKQVLQQTEDAINDLGNRMVSIETDTEAITEAVEIAQDAKNTADNAETIANDAMDVAQAERESAQEAAQEANQAATNAANSASSASTTATQLTAYLATKETLTAPAVDPTLTISGAAADAKATGDALQNIIPSENQLKPQLYDNDNPTIINGFLGYITPNMKFSSSPAAKCMCFPVSPNTKYTFARKTSAGGRETFACFPSIPTDQALGDALSISTETHDGFKYYKITTSATAQYLVMYYYNANDGIAEATIRQWFMLVEGWNIYPYLYYGQVYKLLVFKDNLNENGTAGQTLMVDEDGTSLVWGTPAVSVELDDTLTQPGKAADAKATGDAIAATKTELETEIGQVVLTDGVQQWLDDHPEAMIVIKRNGDADDTPVLDSELLSSSGWTSTGWTGNFTNGFTHTTGNTNPLTLTIPTLEEGGLYQFQITTSNAATNGWSDFYVSLGGSPTFETYKGGGASVSYTYGLICGNTKVLTITPRNDYTGTVTGLSLKKVTNTVGTQYELYDTNGNTTFEFRTVKNTQNALYMGVDSGSKSFYGYENVAVGDRALRDNTGGFWNTAVGRRALESNQMGSRNIAIGYIALLHNTGGDRNVAVGTFALESNTTGRGNTAINADALQDNTTGSYNTAIGVGANSGNVTGSYNIAVGNRALASNTAGTGNIALGRFAMEKATAGSNNIVIGHQACDESGITGSNNIAIGYNVALPSTTGSNQIVIGTSSHTSVVIAGKVLTFNNDGTVTWTSA